jgi:hypothetical protein
MLQIDQVDKAFIYVPDKSDPAFHAFLKSIPTCVEKFRVDISATKQVDSSCDYSRTFSCFDHGVCPDF